MAPKNEKKQTGSNKDGGASATDGSCSEQLWQLSDDDVRRPVATHLSSDRIACALCVILVSHAVYIQFWQLAPLQTELDKLRRDMTDSETELNEFKRNMTELHNIHKPEFPRLDKGEKGDLGPAGSDGAQGHKGDKGDMGERGEGGMKGAPGEPGRSILTDGTVAGGNSIYTRWGRMDCPSISSQVYSGQMTGPNQESAGGGVNYQCLPSHYKVDQSTSGDVFFSTLKATIYLDGLISKLSENSPNPYDHVPCVACEAPQRSTQHMFVGMDECPSSSWTMEYQGYLMSSAEQTHNGKVKMNPKSHRGTYECVDRNAKALKGPPITTQGAPLVFVAAEMSDKAPLPCVVCTK